MIFSMNFFPLPVWKVLSFLPFPASTPIWSLTQLFILRSTIQHLISHFDSIFFPLAQILLLSLPALGHYTLHPLQLAKLLMDAYNFGCHQKKLQILLPVFSPLLPIWHLQFLLLLLLLSALAATIATLMYLLHFPGRDFLIIGIQSPTFAPRQLIF